ncbi:MAG: extracellular solute-binding protein [Chloroflexi bacterium]|nr:extracellular solute-binding protein [Chloroflexota bacterium]
MSESRDRSRLGRRALIKVLVLAAGGSAVAACAQPAPTPTSVPLPKPTEKPVAQATAKPAEPTAPPAPATAKPAPAATAKPALAATSAPAKVPAAKLVLTHWGGEAEAQYMKVLAERFEKAEPGIAIDRLHIPDNYDEKVLTMIAGGTPPDVQMTLRFTYFSFVAKKIALNLQPYLKDAGFNREEYFDVGLRPYTFRGNLYGMPREIDDWVVFYNKDLFDQAGVKYPDGKWTWEDLVANAQKLTKRDSSGRALQFGFGFPHLGGAKPFDGFVYQAGGRVVDNEDEPSRFLMAEADAARGVQFMADLANVHKVAPSPREQKDLGSLDDLFVSGKVAMRYGEFWSSTRFRPAAKFKWDIAEPAREKKQATWVGGACYTVNTKSKRQVESARFVVWAAGKAGATVIAEHAAGIPAIKAVAQSEAFLNTKPPESIKLAVDVFAYGVQPPMSPTFPEWYRELLSALDPVWTGEKKAQDALKTIAPKVQELLDKGRKTLEGI